MLVQDKSWEGLHANLKAVASEGAIARRDYYMLDGCETYVKCFLSLDDARQLTKKVVLISNIEASNPGTGQFRSMITRLEKEATELGYTELRFETITNNALLDMLRKHGYECKNQTEPDGSIWDGVAVKQLNPGEPI